MKSIFVFIMLCFFSCAFAQKQKLRLYTKEFSDYTYAYYYLNNKNDTIIKLRKGEYDWVYMDSIQYFYTGYDTKLKRFVGRNLKNKLLFELYIGPEFTPDFLRENRIRVTNSSKLIGFANEKGKVIISPQFYIISGFSNGYAIFGKECTKEYWGKEKHDSECNHYSIECKIKGVINKKGKVIEEGDFTFEELARKYNWKSESD